MPDPLLYRIIKQIDYQISLLDINHCNLESCAAPLLSLRNNILKSNLEAPSQFNWKITDKNALKILNKIKYKAVWV